LANKLHEKVNPESAAELLGGRHSAIGKSEISVAAASFGTPPDYKNIGRPGWTSDIDCYLRGGGYEQLKQALTLSRDDIVNKVKNSGLRGPRWGGVLLRFEMELYQADEKRRSISSATPTNPSRAHSKTATSFTKIRISCSKEC